MKSLFIFSACVAITGAAIAAGVPGNNTAVVIRKAPVESSTGYQFLCVPVRGFDITGQGTVATLPLKDILPPTTEGLSANTKLIVQRNDSPSGTDASGADMLAKGTYTINNGHWVEQGTGEGTSAAVDDRLLANGALFWLADNGEQVSLPGGFILAASSSAGVSEVLFCGEVAELADGETLAPADSNGVKDSGVKISEDMDITSERFAIPQPNDQIMRVCAGSNEYQYYNYFKYGDIDGWYVLTAENGWVALASLPADDPNRVMKSGEAFYYYRASAAN